MLAGSARIVMLLVIALPSVYAAEFSPVGLWKTIDDNTGKPRGLVRLTQDNGAYQAKIEKIFPKPGEDQHPRCDKCDGTRHGQPILGMTILWGLTRQGDEYQGGEILDPETGRVYRVKMKIEDEGKKLLVRGFIGFSLLGRTQVWLREE
jgi:uncharacterized protein (DUF2147 family)